MSCSERAGGRGFLVEMSHSLADGCSHSKADGWRGRGWENTLSFSPPGILCSLSILRTCTQGNRHNCPGGKSPKRVDV